MEQLGSGDPRRIGSYRLLGRLGAGGMGRVFLARSDRGRTVAIKLVRPELAAEQQFRDRFRAEVGAARRVGGVWTAPVLDADTEATVPWVATGYVAGPALQRIVSGRPGVPVSESGAYGPLPERSVRILAAGLAGALQDIHRAGLIHRDLKPSNVLMTIDGPRVIDFGIARALETVADGGLTRTGALIGSPGFMAPEQVRGERVTTACDVFCLGSVLAYAATGRLPFGVADTGVHALMYRIAQEDPGSDRRTRGPGRADPGLPGQGPGGAALHGRRPGTAGRDGVGGALAARCADRPARPARGGAAGFRGPGGERAPAPSGQSPAPAHTPAAPRTPAAPPAPRPPQQPPGTPHARPTAAGPPPSPPPSYGYPQQQPAPGYGNGFTTPYGPPRFAAPVPPPAPRRRRSAGSAVLLVAVAVLVAIGAGWSVYTFMGDGDGRTTTSPAPSGSRSPSGPGSGPSTDGKSGTGVIPDGYLGTWSGAVEGGGGQSTRRLVIQQGEVGDTVLSLTADGPLDTGDSYHCVFQAPLEAEPSPVPRSASVPPRSPSANR